MLCAATHNHTQRDIALQDKNMQGTGSTAELETSYQCSYLTLHRCRTPYQLHSPITKSDHKEANMTSLVPGADLLV